MSKIEWTEQTWNPIVGCSIVSPGCTHCYAMAMAARNEAMGISRYDGLTRKVNGHAVWTGKVALAPDSTMSAPLKRRKPTTYFVNSMGDLFHEDVPNAWIDRVFAIMALAPQHTFQVLTKRAARMREYLRSEVNILSERIATIGAQMCEDGDNVFDTLANISWPIANVWLGVSTERQDEADKRIPLLLQTPAAVRFISAEPLLGPIDLTRVRAIPDPHAPDEEWLFDSLSTGDMYERRVTDVLGEVWYDSGDGPYRETSLDWVIVGGESGPRARPMQAAWARALRDQCQTAGTPFFFKQWGEHAPTQDRSPPTPGDIHATGDRMVRCGKRYAGRILDGITYNELPGVIRHEC